MRRLVLTLAVMGVAIVLSSGGVALAAIVNGTEGNDTLQGTSGTDYIYGKGGDDTIQGLGLNDYIDAGPGNDTINEGKSGDGYPNVLIGGDGDDLIDAVGPQASYPDYIYCNEGFDRVWGNGNNEYIYYYSGTASGPGCESLLGITQNTSDRISGAFVREGATVQFDSYVLSGGDVTGGKPYDKKTTSTITVNGKPFTVTADPKEKTITQQDYTEYGYQNTLSEADRLALDRAYGELSQFLNEQAGTGELANQELLVLRHLGYLFYASAEGAEITDQTDNYYPTSQEMQAGGEGFTDAVAAFERHMEVGSDGELELDEQGLDQENVDPGLRDDLEGAIETMNEKIRAGEKEASDVFPSSNVRLKPYEQQRPSAQGSALPAQRTGYTSAQYEEEPPPEDNCGGESGTYEGWFADAYYLDSCDTTEFATLLSAGGLGTGSSAAIPRVPSPPAVALGAALGFNGLYLTYLNAESNGVILYDIPGGSSTYDFAVAQDPEEESEE